MNTTRNFFSALVVCTLLLAGSAAQGQAVDISNSYDNSDSINSLYAFSGVIDQTNITWAADIDAGNSAGSGSARFDVNYTGATNDAFNVCGTWANRWPFDFGTIVDATYYTNLSFDVLVSTNSSLSLSNTNTFGDFQVDLLCSVAGQDWVPVPIGKVTIPASATATNKWFHVVLPISQTDPSLAICTGWDIHQESAGDHSGPLTFWIDNLVLLADPPAPPPTMLPPQKINASGLWMNTSASTGSSTNRQSIYSPAVSWVGNSAPVTYSFTIAEFPSGAAKAGFQAHLFLVGNGWNGTPRVPGSDSIVDWNAENLVYLQVFGNGDGSAKASFMFKTNVAPQVTDRWAGQIFGSNTLAALSSASVLGTWSLTFNQDTNVTLTAPDGAVTNFVFPADAVSYFNDNANNYAVFGTQPNTAGNVGSAAVFSQVKISIGSNIMDAGLSTNALDKNWGIAASDPAGVTVIPPDSACWVSWTLPARDFGLYATGTPEDWFSWTPLDTITPILFDNKASAIIPRSFVQTNNLDTKAFFQVINLGQ